MDRHNPVAIEAPTAHVILRMPQFTDNSDEEPQTSTMVGVLIHDEPMLRLQRMQRRWRAFMVLAAVLAITLSSVAVGATHWLSSDLIEITASNKKLETLARVSARINEVETAKRGYVITGDSSFLKPMQGADIDLARLLLRLSDMTFVNADEREDGAILSKLISQRLEESHEVVAAMRQNGFEAARTIIKSGAGRQIQERISQEISSLTRVEEDTAHQAEQHAFWNRAALDGSISIALLLVAGYSSGSLVLGRRYMAALGALRMSEARYRDLIEAAPLPIWVVCQRTGELLFFNNAAATLYGYSREELQFLTFDDLLHEEQRATLAQNRATILNNQFFPWSQWRHRKKDGSDLHVAIKPSQIDFEGRDASLVVGLDETERERLLRCIRRNQGLLQEVFDLQKQIMATLEPDGRIIQVNDQFALIAQIPKAELRGQLICNLALWGSLARVADQPLRNHIEIVGQSALPASFELRHSAMTGGERVLMCSLRPVSHEGSALAYLIFQGHDITELIQTTQALERSERRLLAAQIRARMCSWEHDIASGDFWWSTGTDCLFKLPDRQSPKSVEDIAALAAPEDIERLRQFLTDLPSTYERSSIRVRCDARIAPDRHLEVVAECIRDPDGHATQLVGSVMDVSERNSLERSLQQAQRLEAIGRLTGGVAHDFNNLLSVIIGSSETLAQELPDHDIHRELAELSLTAALRGAALTRQLLAFARRQPLHPQVVNPVRLLKEMEGLIRKALGTEIEVDICFPESVCSTFVDGAQLESAIFNLVINARDAMPNGGGLQIEVSERLIDVALATAEADLSVGSYVQFRLTDDGIGIDEEIIERIFEPFFSTKTGGDNSGLGLSMVHGFVKQSGGHIRVTSKPEQGTTFALLLPCYQGDEIEDPETENETAPLPRGEESVLLVEDDELVRKQVKRQLESLGYSVTTASNGREAIEMFKENPAFDLIMTDLSMPGGMSGKDLARKIFMTRPDMPMIFTSGDAARYEIFGEDSVKALLEKPYRIDTLSYSVRAAIDRK